MALFMTTVRLSFPPTTGRPQTVRGTACLPGTIRTVGYALNGFAIGYTSGDHHVWKSEVDIQPMSACGNTAVFDVNFLLRDKSGNIDDRYGGWVDVLVIADLV